MIDEVDGGKLLFLTNAQADLIAESNASLQKMVGVLEMPKPKLVINLLCPVGFRNWCTTFNHPEEQPLFASFEEETAAEEKVDRYPLCRTSFCPWPRRPTRSSCVRPLLVIASSR